MNKNDRQLELYNLRRPLWLTRAGLLAEQAVRAFWPLWTVLLVLFFVLSFGLHNTVSLEIFWTGAVGLFAAFIGAGFYATKNFHWVSADDAVDALDKSMPGRPLTATFDEMAIGAEDEASRTVWDAHVTRTRKRLAAAKAVQPDLKIAARDPFALRYAALLLFVVAVLFGSILRLGAPQGVLPGTPGEAVIAGPSWEAWVEPPAYTAKPTIYLNDVTVGMFEVPQGSEITVRLYGQVGTIPWSETLSGTEPPSEPKSAFSIDVTRSGTLTIDARSWEISARADQPPKVWFQGAIERSIDGEMKLPFNASDDYAVESGTTTVLLHLEEIDRRYGLAVAPEPREPVVLDLPMPISGNRDNFSELLVENMAEHPWAGLNVRFSLDVLDSVGQDSPDEFVETTLPGRRFFQPIAAAVIEQRRDILWSRENAKRVSQVLKTITYDPDGYFPNETAYLTIRRAIERLDIHRNYGLSEEKRDEIAAMLWAAATMLENGRLSDALERLRRVQERLNQAMEEGASDEEISELMQELQDAMREYMEQLAQEPREQQQGEQGESQQMTQQDLQDMLDRIEELMKEGRTAEAQELLQQLMEMMENMQMAEGQQGEGQQGQGDQAMQGLQETLRDQQGLSDEAFRDLQEQFNPGAQAGENEGNTGRNGGQGQGQSHEGDSGEGQAEGEGQQEPGEGQSGAGEESLADRQDQLRRELNRQRNQPLPGAGTEAGEAAREALERADDAMGRAEEALRNEDTADALDAQSDAMDALREGMRNLGEAMAENQQQGQQGDMPGQTSDRSQDPLGREPGENGQIGTDQGLLGDELAQRRSRELLDEIRRRSGDQERPEVERDYLKRLLDQF
ncbi:MAG: TIGR02302 family protein [Pseudomonadota bacterium]